MAGRNSFHYCYDVSYQCWFASEEAKIYCDNFNNSNAVVCSHLIFAYTARLAIINAMELERNGWLFFTFIEECCVVIENNIDQKLANRISYQIWYKGCLKGKFGRGGSKFAKWDPYPLTNLDWGGVQIRGASKSAVTPAQLQHSDMTWIFWHDFNFLARLFLARLFQGTTPNFFHRKTQHKNQRIRSSSPPVDRSVLVLANTVW